MDGRRSSVAQTHGQGRCQGSFLGGTELRREVACEGRARRSLSIWNDIENTNDTLHEQHNLEHLHWSTQVRWRNARTYVESQILGDVPQIRELGERAPAFNGHAHRCTLGSNSNIKGGGN